MKIQQKGRQVKGSHEIARASHMLEQRALNCIACPHIRKRIEEAYEKKSEHASNQIEFDLSYLDLKQCSNLSMFKIGMLRLQANSLITLPKSTYLPDTLTYLSLGANNIESIESLHSLNLQNLKILKLYSNKISRVKQIRKCMMPNIEHLNLQDNPITDLGFVAQFNRNWSNFIKTEIIVNNPMDRMLELEANRIRPKCHPTKLSLTLAFG